MRRSTVGLLIAATIVVGAGVGFGASRVIGDDDPAPTPTQTTSATSATPDPEPTLLDYSDRDGGEVVLDDPDDLSAIADAPQDFREFTETALRELIEQNRVACPDGEISVGVSRIMPRAGFATGAVNACGGYVAVWKRESTGWNEIIATQEAIICSDLTSAQVPADLLVDPRCYDEEAQDLVAYQG